MATGPRYTVPMRRRREVRTDYHQRLRLLKSGKPRLVARKSNRHVRAQLVIPSSDGDVVEASAKSGDLAEYGWEAPTGNLPSAYLTGLVAGARAIEEGIEEAVLDIGLNTATPGNKVFAVQEGAIDAGLEIPHGEEVFAEWERTRGEHVADYAEQLDESLYAGEFDASDLPAHFDETRETIMNEFDTEGTGDGTAAEETEDSDE